MFYVVLAIDFYCQVCGVDIECVTLYFNSIGILLKIFHDYDGFINKSSNSKIHAAPLIPDNLFPFARFLMRYRLFFMLYNDTDYEIPVSTLTPPVSMPTEGPVFKQCGWSSWLNSNSPSASLSSGDFESIYDLKSKYGLCKEIRQIECRIAGSHTPVALAGQESVACDIRNGLRCYNRDQISGRCYDYEVRVLCWVDNCKC